MAEKIELILVRKRRPFKYPWKEWADGDTWQLDRGIDYVISDTSMQVAAHSFASRHGLRALTKTNERGVILRFYRPEPVKKLKKLKKVPPAKK